MFKALQAWILSKKYTKETVEGAGAVKGKNCTIDSVLYKVVEEIQSLTKK